MSRTDLDATTLANSLRMRAGDGSMEWVYEPIQASVLLDIADMLDENAKLRELCADMLHDAMENVCFKAYWCDEKNWQTCNDKSCGNHLYVDMARELGIGVDE